MYVTRPFRPRMPRSVNLTAGTVILLLSLHPSYGIHDCSSERRGRARRLCLRRGLTGERAVARAASRCPAGCTANGVCNEEVGRCDCPRLFTGPSCGSPVADAAQTCAAYALLDKRGCKTDLPCFNNCNSKGKCVAGVCHCQPGYWGIDCALSMGPNGKPQLLDGRYVPRKTGVKVYVYELPFNLTTWFSFTRQDRPLQILFWQRLTASGMRTLDGDEADYYLLPVYTRGGQARRHLEWALDYIKRTWPWWYRDNGHRHIAIHGGDMGFNDFSETMREELGDNLSNMTWLTHWGLHEDHEGYGWRKAHRPGKDIVIPVILTSPGMEVSPLNPAIVAAAEAQGRDLDKERNGTLFFAGRVCGDRAHPDEASGTCTDYHSDYSLGVRQAVYLHHHKRKGFKLVVSSDSYLEDMTTHKFCLAPVGGGHGKRQVLVSLMGCVPVLIGDGVLQPFEPELNWSQFSVSVPEADVSKLHTILKQVPAKTLAAKQKRLRCTAQHLFYSNTYGSILGDDGRYDAFETLMEILRVRRDHPDVAPEKYAAVDERFRKFVNCDLDEDAEAVALCTQGHQRQFPERRTCDQCKYRRGVPSSSPLAIAGGMLCCQDPDESKCPRPWQ